MIGHVLQIQLLVLFALRMKVYPAHTSVALIETNVVKPLKTRTRYSFDPVIGYEEVFFPAHKDVLALLVVFEGK